MDKVLENKEEKKYSRWEWYLLVVVIPLLFASVVALLVLWAAGINVFDAAKEYSQKIPFVSEVLKKENPKIIEDYESKMIDLEAEIKDREAKISQLETKMDSQDQEIERLQLEKEQLESEIAELTAIQEENKRAFKDIVRTYEVMSAKKAAPIITEMADEDALKILTNVKAETLAGIMESMNPEDAAKFTELLTNKSENSIGASP